MNSLQDIGINQALQIVLLVRSYSAQLVWRRTNLFSQLSLYHILLEDRGVHQTCPYLHQRHYVLHHLKSLTQLAWAEELQIPFSTQFLAFRSRCVPNPPITQCLLADNRLKLHIDYLCSQSTLLRGLFAGANPLDLINAAPIDPTEKSTLPFSVPANRLPRVLPSTTSHPNVFLPVPDPTSFHLLVHWMYFGHTRFIDDCLDRGIVHLTGITKNAEYLGLPQQLLDYLHRWVKMPFYGEYSSDEVSDSEPFYRSDDSMDVDEEPMRGRTQTTRHLTHLQKAEKSFH